VALVGRRTFAVVPENAWESREKRPANVCKRQRLGLAAEDFLMLVGVVEEVEPIFR
jgi:hypothetical protein